MLPVSLDCLRPVSGLSILHWFSLTFLLSFLCCVFFFYLSLFVNHSVS